ncbi:hypothetical protein D621_07500 [beta proteobacterium AAP51]|nr:hypothetical protein D621_07500 [beta proteobacterium AAP51]
MQRRLHGLLQVHRPLIRHRQSFAESQAPALGISRKPALPSRPDGGALTLSEAAVYQGPEYRLLGLSGKRHEGLAALQRRPHNLQQIHRLLVRHHQSLAKSQAPALGVSRKLALLSRQAGVA